jgi:hypothetical protein
MPPCYTCGGSRTVPQAPHPLLGDEIRALRRLQCEGASSMSPPVSNLRPTPPSVITAFAGNRWLSFSRPLVTASRTAYSIWRWALTPSFFRKFRALVLRASSSMIVLLGSQLAGLDQRAPQAIRLRLSTSLSHPFPHPKNATDRPSAFAL